MILRFFAAIEARVARLRVRDDKVFVHYPKEADTAPFPDAPAFNLVGFWNEEVARLNQMRPFAPPALFVEVLPMAWTPMGRGVLHADATIRLHLVTATLAPQNSPYREEWERRFILARGLKQCLAGFCGKPDARGLSFSTFQPFEAVPDHNYEQIAHDIYSFRTHAIDASALFEHNSMMTPLPVTLDTGEVFSPQFGVEMV